MIRLLIIFSLLLLTACGGGGGGGGPVAISVPTQTLTTLSVKTDVVGNSFLSVLRDIADDKQVDIDEAYEAFQWINSNPTFNADEFSNVEITIDGTTMSIAEGYQALKGFKKRYYDGKETFWATAVNDGKFDDESAEFTALTDTYSYDATLSKDAKMAMYKDQGSGEVVVTKTSTANESSTTTTTSDPVATSTTTQRSETIDNGDGSSTVNVYDVTTTTTVITTTVTVTVTPVTTYTWSDGSTTTQSGSATSTSTSTEASEESTSETLVSSDVTHGIVSSEEGEDVTTETTTGEATITTATSTRTEQVENGDGSITTNTYTVTTTTTTTPTTVTTTTTPKTTHTWSDGSTTVDYGTPVITESTTSSSSSSTSEVLASSTTTGGPAVFRTDEYLQSTGLSHINAASAYARGWTGDGVTIAIVDTGIDTTHTDLPSDRFSTYKLDHTYSLVEDTAQVDTHSHGTHVAGIMAAEKNDTGTHGVAYDANVISVGNAWTPSNWRYVMPALSEMNVTAVNLSVNVHQNLDKIGNIDAYVPVQPDQDRLNAWKTATDNGMIIVNSAGNHGYDHPALPGQYATWTEEDGSLYLGGKMLIVGSVGYNDITDTYEMSSWSNKAGHLCQNITYTDGVASGCTDEYLTKDFFMVAPGSGIYSTANTGGIMPMSGTSMAAPYVTGSLAVLKEAWPQLTSDQLVGLITSTATDLGDPGIDSVYGHGLVDLNEATKPQGTIQAVQPSGSLSTLSGGISGDATLSSLDNISTLSSFTVMDSYNRDYNLDMNQATNFKITERPLTNAYSSYEAMQFIGPFAMSNNGNDMQYEDWIYENVKLRFGLMNQDEALFGTAFQGSLGIKDSTTYYSGLELHRQIDNWKVFGSYTRGWSEVKASNNSYLKDSDGIESQQYYVGAETQWNKSKLQVKAGTQLHIIDGGFNYSVPTSYNWVTDTTNFTNGSADAKSNDVPRVFELDFVHQFTDNLTFDSSFRHTNTRQDDETSVQFNLKYAIQF